MEQPDCDLTRMMITKGSYLNVAFFQLNALVEYQMETDDFVGMPKQFPIAIGRVGSPRDVKQKHMLIW